MGVRFYCSSCGLAQPIIIEPMQSDALNGDAIWGDIVCEYCHLVLVTVIVDEPGEYEIVKKRLSAPVPLDRPE